MIVLAFLSLIPMIYQALGYISLIEGIIFQFGILIIKVLYEHK